MHEEELIQKLNASFTLAATPIKEGNGKGYRISMNVPWHENGLGVKSYHVQLCGIDPISGEDVRNHKIKAQFNFMKTSHKTDILTYHGEFYLACTAYLNDGRIVLFKEQKINLEYPQNSPYIKCTVTNKGEFKHVKLESNCWINCADKVWLRFDGHEQRVALPVRNDKTIRFYVPASGSVEVRVEDAQIQIK